MNKTRIVSGINMPTISRHCNSAAESAVSDLAATDQRLSLLTPDRARTDEDPRTAMPSPRTRTPDNGNVPDGRQGDASTEDAAVPDAPSQLVALLRPGRSGPGEHPRGARDSSVRRPADHAGVAVSRQRDAPAEATLPGLAGAGQLVALLRPGRAGAREHPRRTPAIVTRAPDHGSIAVGGQRNTPPEAAVADTARRDQLVALLLPAPAGAHEDPRRSLGVVTPVPTGADKGGAPVGGQGDTRPEFAVVAASWGSGQLVTKVDEWAGGRPAARPGSKEQEQRCHEERPNDQSPSPAADATPRG